MNTQAEQMHPKLADAETLERAAKTIRKFQDEGTHLTEKMELVEAMLIHSGKLQWKEERYFPAFASKVNPGYLEKRAQELRQEFERERNPAPIVSEDAQGLGANRFAAEVKLLAHDLVCAATNLEHSPIEVRNSFLKVFFQRADELAKRLQKAGLGGPRCIT